MNFDVSELVRGPSGKLSAMRIGFLFSLFTILINWSWINFNKTELTPIPENAVSLIVGLAGAKVIQRYGEKKDSTTNTKTTE